MAPNRVNHSKASYVNTQQRDEVAGKPKPRDQGHCKNNAFTLSAALPIITRLRLVAVIIYTTFAKP